MVRQGLGSVPHSRPFLLGGRQAGGPRVAEVAGRGSRPAQRAQSLAEGEVVLLSRVWGFDKCLRGWTRQDDWSRSVSREQSWAFGLPTPGE